MFAGMWTKRARTNGTVRAYPCRWAAAGGRVPFGRDEVRRDPRDLPVLLRGARPPAPAVGISRAGAARPVGPPDHGGHAPAQALLPRHREAAATPAHVLPEVLPHAGHRPGRRHHAPPD